MRTEHKHNTNYNVICLEVLENKKGKKEKKKQGNFCEKANQRV